MRITKRENIIKSDTVRCGLHKFALEYNNKVQHKLKEKL